MLHGRSEKITKKMYLPYVALDQRLQRDFFHAHTTSRPDLIDGLKDDEKTVDKKLSSICFLFILVSCNDELSVVHASEDVKSEATPVPGSGYYMHTKTIFKCLARLTFGKHSCLLVLHTSTSVTRGQQHCLRQHALGINEC